MREVKSLSSTLRSTIASLKQAHITAGQKFNAEVTASQANLAKVQSFTQELADSNRELEQVLGESGSNFPTSEPPGDHLSDPVMGIRLNMDIPRS